MSDTVAGRQRSLAAIAGEQNLTTDPERLRACSIDGLAPAIVVRPANPEEITEILRFCAAEKLAVVPVGAGTKLSLGAPPSRYDVALVTTRLARVLSYDPGDLTLSVETGARLADLTTLLAQHQQLLPLAVPFSRQATVGGTVASGVDSPLRQRYGSVRDFLLGAEFVTGEAVAARSGGRVVKNVAGYDLHKLLIGSLGTLGVITRLNFKTFPLPEASRGFLASFSSETAALEMLRRVSASPLAPATLEILDPALAGLFARLTPPSNPDLAPLGDWFPASQWLVAAGYGGNEAVLGRYAGDLARLASETGATGTDVLGDDRRPPVWGRLREAIPLLLAASPATTIVRVSVLPSRIGEILAAAHRAAERHHLSAATLARGSGAVYVAFLPADSAADSGEAGALKEELLAALAAAATELVDSAAAADGFASVPWSPAPLKSRIPVWGRERADLPLMRRVKKVFDPEGLLSPGRFLGGI
jgi:glycolate oxidase FAD binding subunit